MGIYKHVQELWKKPKENLGELWRERLIAWRREAATVKIERPTRIDRARAIGYRAKQGIVVVRQRVPRGGHKRSQPKKGRRPKRFGTKLNLSKNYQQIAEERAAKKFTNLSLLNSYWVAEDGKSYWFEIIFADHNHPVIKADKKLAYLQTVKNQNKVFQGQTSAGRRGRGLI